MMLSLSNRLTSVGDEAPRRPLGQIAGCKPVDILAASWVSNSIDLPTLHLRSVSGAIHHCGHGSGPAFQRCQIRTCLV